MLLRCKRRVASLRKLKFKSGKIEIDIDDTKTKLRLQTTGKTTVGSSDGKTTAMPEKGITRGYTRCNSK